MTRSTFIALVICSLAAFGLSACGKKGDVNPPASYEAPAHTPGSGT